MLLDDWYVLRRGFRPAIVKSAITTLRKSCEVDAAGYVITELR